MAARDPWDKFEVIIKLISSVVLVAIPVMISIGANRISQSMERGKMVESLLAELTNDSQKVRRDLALIALDAAVPPPERCAFLGFADCRIDEEAPDMVTEVALVLWNNLDSVGEADQAAKVITKRKPKTHTELLASAGQVTSAPREEAPSDKEVAQTAQRAVILSKLISKAAAPVDNQLKGVRAVYIQYRSDRAAAELLRDELRDKGVVVPRLELVPGIKQNDIRYPGPGEKEAASRLREFLVSGSKLNLGMPEGKLIDLSARGYRVPPGQFEVWIDR